MEPEARRLLHYKAGRKECLQCLNLWANAGRDGGGSEDTERGSAASRGRARVDVQMEPRAALRVFRVVTRGTFSVPHAAATVLLGANLATGDASTTIARRVRDVVILIGVNDDGTAIGVKE